MNCYLCRKPIHRNSRVEYHHPVYKSQGGTATEPTHKACHRRHHSEQGDFKAWGRIGGLTSAQTCAWSITLPNLRHHPAYVMERAYYLAHYARGGVR